MYSLARRNRVPCACNVTMCLFTFWPLKIPRNFTAANFKFISSLAISVYFFKRCLDGYNATVLAYGQVCFFGGNGRVCSYRICKSRIDANLKPRLLCGVGVK